MSHASVALFETGTPGAFRFDLAPGDAPARDVDAIRADIEAAAEGGASWIEFGPFDPVHHPALEDAMWCVDDVGLRAKATTLGGGLAERGVLEKLRNAGLAQLTFLFHGGDAATHDAHVGREGAFEEALEALDIASRLNSLLVRVRYVLLRDNHDQVGTFVERVRDPADRLELVRLSALTRDRTVLRAHGVPRRPALRAVQAAWEAARVAHLRMTTEAFTTWPSVPMPTETPLQPVDATLLELLRANVPVPAARNGTWATPRDGDVSGLWYAVEGSRSLHELGLQLAAYGCPPLDLPPALGGMGLDQPPGEARDDAPAVRRIDGVPALIANVVEGTDARPLPAWEGVGRGANVHVVAGFVTDNILALSTLPGLTDALRASGADATLHSVWRAPVNPYDTGHDVPEDALQPSSDPARPGVRYPDDLVPRLGTIPARYAHARKQAPGFVAGLDLSGADLVVVPGFDNALAVLDNPSLPDDARVVVPDFHLLTGLASWHERFATDRSMEGGWWPSERIEVHALYPRYVRAYWRAGVPLRQVTWRPYPVHLAHFGAGVDVLEAQHVFAGGAHQRDWATLAEAAKRRAGGLPLQVHTRETVPAPLETQGEVPLLAFYEAIANSRYVVLPLVPDPRRPAGISVAALALAAGRPVIATTTYATIDHLRHGHDAILVPPNRPDALAKAMDRLDQDDDLVAALAAGARRASQELSVRRWAEGLLDGFPAQRVWSMGDEGRGPFWSWPA